MRLRLAAVLFLSLSLASGATAATRTGAAATATIAAPQDLHAFLLRADEPSSDTFTRTPSFAWKPALGAVRYQFELATSRTFAGGSLLWSSKTLTSPAAAVPVSLPWISGTPYSVYARVRGVSPNGATGPWSQLYGFNTRWASVPSPLSAPPGLIRWTTVEGANAYQIWFLDSDKIITTTTNVADEREYFTFHQTMPQFTGAVHWRIRAIRALYGVDAQARQETNGIPTESRGPWSPIYTTTNTAFKTGPLKLLQTVSDATSTQTNPAAHHLMPAFIWQGNVGIDGTSSELYRIYVSTDRDCVNIVFRGAIVGSPAYAPRVTGPLALPGDVLTQGAARTSFLGDGNEGATITADGYHYEPNEALKGDDSPLKPGEDDSPDVDKPTTPTTDPAAPPTTGTTSQSTTTGNELPIVGMTIIPPPIDLWDTDGPTGRYFWTVVPVDTVTSTVLNTTLSASAATGSSTIVVAAAAQLIVGDQLQVGSGANQETVAVVSISGSNVTVAPALKYAHGAGDRVVRLGGGVQYRDAELPQDACAAGRVLSFGKTSEPALTRGPNLAPFASGLSPFGKLVSAQSTRPTFYGAPLVSWQPAVGATGYEVQWSKRSYPFKPEGQPVLTFSTSSVLTLSPGNWWYRVRGLNLALPAGARAMGWSDPVAIKVAKPTFKVVPTKKK
jgi:hypothetical protein